MPLSIWEYLRARTRDAVLAGINDAMDIAEQGDTNGSQHLAATQLASRLAATEARGLPEPSRNGSDGAAAQRSPLEAPKRLAEPAAFDDELERRIDAAASQGAEERPETVVRPRAGQSGLAPPNDAEKPPATVPPGRITNRKRGRPPKNKQGGN